MSRHSSEHMGLNHALNISPPLNLSPPPALNIAPSSNIPSSSSVEALPALRPVGQINFRRGITFGPMSIPPLVDLLALNALYAVVVAAVIILLVDPAFEGYYYNKGGYAQYWGRAVFPLGDTTRLFFWFALARTGLLIVKSTLSDQKSRADASALSGSEKDANSLASLISFESGHNSLFEPLISGILLFAVLAWVPYVCFVNFWMVGYLFNSRAGSVHVFGTYLAQAFLGLTILKSRRGKCVSRVSIVLASLLGAIILVVMAIIK